MSQPTERKLKKWMIPAGVASLLVLGVAGYFFGRSTTQKTDEHSLARATAVDVDPHTAPHDGHAEGKGVPPADRKPASQPEEEDLEPESADEEIEVQIAHSAHKQPHAAADTHAEPEAPKTLTDRVIDFFVGVQLKVDAIRRAEDDSRRLQLENAHLRVMLETSRYACLSDEAKKQTEKIGSKLNAETGTKIGRTLASIPYQIPENMMPDALYTLGVSYFKARDSEKAVAILSFLADMQGDDTYKTPTNFLMTGISWFRLDNFKYADEYFSRVIDLKPTKENKAYKVQAKVWKALVAQHQKNPTAAQAWLKRTLESHPQTKEARWINPQEGDRLPASSHHEAEQEEAAPVVKHDEHAKAPIKAEAQHHDEAKNDTHAPAHH